MSVKCRVDSCVYNNANKCVLKQLIIDENGKCSDCLTASYCDLSPLNHLNYNGKGGMYCRIRHEIIHDINGCHGCSLLKGSLQGDGVECLWDDFFGGGFMQFYDPKQELLRVSNLIDRGCFNRYPSVNGEQCHKLTLYGENFKRKVAEDAARPRIYTKEQMIDWPDDADAKDVEEYFKAKINSDKSEGQ